MRQSETIDEEWRYIPDLLTDIRLHMIFPPLHTRPLNETINNTRLDSTCAQACPSTSFSYSIQPKLGPFSLSLFLATSLSPFLSLSDYTRSLRPNHWYQANEMITMSYISFTFASDSWREREGERERERERGSEREREGEGECVCARAREKERQRRRKRECVRESEGQRESVCVRVCVCMSVCACICL